MNGNFDSYSYECACAFVSVITLLLFNQFQCFQKNIFLTVYNSHWPVLSYKELQELSTSLVGNTETVAKSDMLMKSIRG